MEVIYSRGEFSLILWGLLSLIGGGLLAFGPPSLMRGFNRAKGEDEKSFIYVWNRLGGFLFFTIAHIVLLISLVDGISSRMFTKAALVVVIFFGELFILHKYKLIVHSMSSDKAFRIRLFSLFIAVLINLAAYIAFFQELLIAWIALIVVQSIIGFSVFLYIYISKRS